LIRVAVYWQNSNTKHLLFFIELLFIRFKI
jgi:hypothetical protein